MKIPDDIDIKDTGIIVVVWTSSLKTGELAVTNLYLLSNSWILCNTHGFTKFVDVFSQNA